MLSLRRTSARLGQNLRLSWQALRSWPPRRYAAAGLFALGIAVLIGIPTVIIPNPVFGRDIPVVAWNYPVWLATSLLTGMLAATYVRIRPAAQAADSSTEHDETAGNAGTAITSQQAASAERPGRLGMVGGVLTWFAVGCPVCNKIALLALGYSGALAWFAPLQPVLAVLALAFVTVALVARLRGEVACPLPSRPAAASAGAGADRA